MTLKEALEHVEGLEVVETVVDADGFAILFDDGIIINVADNSKVTLTTGRGWEEHWNQLTS